MIEQGKKQRRGSAGVSFGNPTHLLDAAVTNAWENITPTTIKNAFIKADLCIDLESEVAEDNVCIDDLISELAEIKITLTNEEFREKLHLDDKTIGEYQNCLVEEIKELIEEHENETKKSTPTININNKPFDFNRTIL